MPAYTDSNAISYSQLINYHDKIVKAIDLARQSGHAFTKSSLQQLIETLPQHSSFHYVNNGYLTSKYFKIAEEACHDEYLYLILTDSGSPASEVISVFTQKRFNHISLAFDSNLDTIISYNGGQYLHPPGLNLEMIECFNQKADSSILVYRLKATKEQKELILNKIREINTEGSAYNLLGLLTKHSFKPNIMFCSQFVYSMLKYANLEYFDMKNTEVKPSDLIELDYHRKLEYLYEVKLNDRRI